VLDESYLKAASLSNLKAQAALAPGKAKPKDKKNKYCEQMLLAALDSIQAGAQRTHNDIGAQLDDVLKMLNDI
jgi:hypothetical protein